MSFSTGRLAPVSQSVAAWTAPLRPVVLVAAMLLLLPAGAQAHHLMELTHQSPSPLLGLLSGLAHPLIGPDHLLFLLALSLVGWRQRSAWMLGLLAIGLAGSCLGLVLPGLPAAEALISLTLVVVALVLFGRVSPLALLPAFALHGYGLSAAVLGWNAAPIGFYLLGLLISQGLLLLLALAGLRGVVSSLSRGTVRGLAAALLGCGAAWTWSSLVG
ncbi:MAG: HupE/UreJ family protein [Synechococcaceae cyanobacterium]|nr:HupE/UreJ family protein [Synechococcaceae cyanobacterium]